jgi:hypothetical protein
VYTTDVFRLPLINEPFDPSQPHQEERAPSPPLPLPSLPPPPTRHQLPPIHSVNGSLRLPPLAKPHGADKGTDPIIVEREEDSVASGPVRTSSLRGPAITIASELPYSGRGGGTRPAPLQSRDASLPPTTVQPRKEMGGN